MVAVERLTSDAEGMVIACPECDHAGCVRPHKKSDTFGCDECGSVIDEYNEREEKPNGVGGMTAKYGHLTLEDVGLERLET